MNPVLIVLGLVLTPFGCVGLWTFLSLFVTRKEDRRTKGVDAVVDLETGSVSLRKDLVSERDRAVTMRGVLAAVVIPLLRSVDRILPRVVDCITVDEMTAIRGQTDDVWKAIEPQ